MCVINVHCPSLKDNCSTFQPPSFHHIWGMEMTHRNLDDNNNQSLSVAKAIIFDRRTIAPAVLFPYYVDLYELFQAPTLGKKATKLKYIVIIR